MVLEKTLRSRYSIGWKSKKYFTVYSRSQVALGHKSQKVNINRTVLLHWGWLGLYVVVLLWMLKPIECLFPESCLLYFWSIPNKKESSMIIKCKFFFQSRPSSSMSQGAQQQQSSSSMMTTTMTSSQQQQSSSNIQIDSKNEPIP